MNYYQLRDGVALTCICGEYILVAMSKARPYCKKLQQINETGADIITILQEQPKDLDGILQKLGTLYAINDNEELRRIVLHFLEELISNGYVLKK